MAPRWQLTSNLTCTERAPKDYKVFADGPHVATAGYEVGDSALGKERSTQFDIGAAWKSGADAFTGLEASGNIRLFESTSTVDLALRADMVRANSLGTDQPLSRIAPARVGATLKFASGPFGAALGFDHKAARRRVPAGDRTTDAYPLWNATAIYRVKAGPAQLLWFACLDNRASRR